MTTEETSRFIGTANHGFSQHAQEEIRRLITGVKFTYMVPNEIFLFESPKSISEIQHILREQEPIFLRHIQPAQYMVEITRTASDLKLIEEWISGLSITEAGERITLQIRRTSSASFEYSTSEIRDILIPLFTDSHGVTLVPRASDKIISLFISESTLYIGCSHPLDNLSDWSGGAIRYQKEEGQISRAKFKLLEAEEEFELDFTQYHHALDIGAAPGGWTSLLLERGLSVTAVDPAELHPNLKHHHKLTYHKKNASEVSFAANTFDLLVSDMSWSPRQMTKLVIELLHTLETHGTAIITLKLMHKKPFQAVKEVCSLFESHLDFKRAKQLFHNREELTLYFTKK